MYQEKQGGQTVTHLSRQEARSGTTPHVTRYVLGISLTLIVIIFAVLLATGFFNTAQTGADQSHQASSTEING